MRQKPVPVGGLADGRFEVLLVCTGRDSHKPRKLGTYRRGQVPPYST
jgi:hypothetical protein